MVPNRQISVVEIIISYSTTDRDECSDGSAQCEHECRNIMSGTANSYQCTCKKGFSLSEDQHNCKGEVVGNNWDTFGTDEIMS